MRGMGFITLEYTLIKHNQIGGYFNPITSFFGIIYMSHRLFPFRYNQIAQIDLVLNQNQNCDRNICRHIRVRLRSDVILYLEILKIKPMKLP